MLQTTYFVKQPFLTWGPRTVKRSWIDIRGSMNLDGLGGGGELVISNLNLAFHSIMNVGNKAIYGL
jgi:hypothetical protein